MGLWDMDVSSFSVSPTADLEQVRIVAAVDFDQDNVEELAADIDDLRGKVLFRVPMPSIPNANVMETDLTFENGATKTLKIGKDGSLTGANFSVAANGNITAKAITATTGAFSGVVTGQLRSTKTASAGQACAAGEIATDGTNTLICKSTKFAALYTLADLSYDIHSDLKAISDAIKAGGGSSSGGGGSGGTQTCQCSQTKTECTISVTSNTCPLSPTLITRYCYDRTCYHPNSYCSTRQTEDYYLYFTGQACPGATSAWSRVRSMGTDDLDTATFVYTSK
jgi:hypothetical protein